MVVEIVEDKIVESWCVVLVSFTDVKSFPEARGSLIYFFSFQKSRRLRRFGQPPTNVG
jgi:hypothetical protein